MSERKHTPGPWRAGIEGNNRVYGPDNMGEYSGLVATVIHHRDKHLIAAAPDMFDALELHRAYETTPTDRGGKSGPKGRARAKWLAARDTALAKAKGQTP